MVNLKCHDCSKRKSCVKSRQSDYDLCQQCQDKRDREDELTKAKDQQQSTLQKIISTPTKLLNTGFMAASSLLTDQYEPMKPQSDKPIFVEEVKKDEQLLSSKCPSCNCDFVSPSEPVGICSFCDSKYHISCAGLTKPPVRKWTCPECRNLHSLAKNLQMIVTGMQREIQHLKKSQETIRSENVRIKSQQSSLKKTVENLQTENVQLNQEVSQLKDALNKKVDHLSATASTCPALSNDAEHRAASLLIGDSMLRDIDSCMFENSEVKPMSGATVAEVFEELKSRNDLHNFQDIVIHAGTNDISKNVAFDETVGAMEASVTHVMVKAPTTRTHISAVCPRTKGDAHKVNTLNEALKELAHRTDSHFIDSGSQMIYQNGYVDSTQLETDGLHLSERGTNTMKNVFLESVPSLVKSQGTWSDAVKRKKPSRATQNQRGQRRQQQKPSLARRDLQGQQKNQQTRGNREYRQPRQDTYGQTAKHKKNGYSGTLNLTNNTQNMSYATNNYQSIRNVSNKSDFNHESNNYSGCWKCGLFNHNSETCFHKYQLKCKACHNYGHKEKYCSEW